MRKEVWFICDYCRTNWKTEQECLECEDRCKSKRDKTYNYRKRLKTIMSNHYVINVKSIEDLEGCIESCFSGYLDGYEYEDYEYPCNVMIYTYSKQEPYESYHTDYIHVESVSILIDRLSKL